MSVLTTVKAPAANASELFDRLRRGEPAVWLKSKTNPLPAPANPLTYSEVNEAEARLHRFAPALAALFPAGDWDGRISSPLLGFPGGVMNLRELLVKADHLLPMTGSVKARGGVYELLCYVEDLAHSAGLLKAGDESTVLLAPEAKQVLTHHKIVVASTGNLGFSIGLVARALGLEADIHMSHDAKHWKKSRLRAIGATVVEHEGDYGETVARARTSAMRSGAYFVDDEKSRRLFVGYATAAAELAQQMSERGIAICSDRPLIVYLPCGVGGAPGGITAGLKQLFHDAVIPVFVEPSSSACMLVALASGGHAVPVYEFGLKNDTIADGLAVPRASQLVIDLVGQNIEAVVAVNDALLLKWVRYAWESRSLRLETSGAAGFAAIAPFLAAVEESGRKLSPEAVHLVWTTGGSLLPDAEFQALLAP